MTTAMQCAAGLVKRHGLDPAEAEAITTEMWAEKAKLAAEGTATADALAKSMVQAFDEKRFANVKMRQRTALSIQKYRNLNNAWDTLRQSDENFKSGKLSFVEFMASELVGAGERFAGARDSTASAAHSLHLGRMGQLEQTWEDIATRNGRDLKFISDTLADKNAIQEHIDFANEVLDPGSTNNPLMAEAAKALNEITEDLRVRGNMEGGDVGKLNTGYLPQSHDPHRLLSAKNGGMEGWMNFIESRLDWERTMPDVPIEDRQGILSSLFNTISLNRDLQTHVVEYPMPKSTGHARHRILHFKDGKSFAEYHQKYGVGSMVESINSHVRQATNRVTLLERLGHQPELMVSRLVEREKTRLRYEIDAHKQQRMAYDRAQQEMLVAKKEGRLTPEMKEVAKAAKAELVPLEKLESDLKKLQKAYDTKFKSKPAGEIARYMSVLMGETRSPVNPSAAAVMANVRALKTLISMGMAGLSTMTDMATVSTMQRAFGVDMHEAYGNAVTNYFKRYPKGSAQRQVALELGFLTESTLGHALSRLDIDYTTPGTLSKLANKFHRLSGLTFLSERQKTGHALTMSRHLGRSRDLAWEQLTPEVREGMSYHGFNADTWKLVRHMMEQYDGEWYLSATNAKRLTEAQLKPFLPERLQGDTPPQGVSAENFRLAKEREFYRQRNRIETQVLSFFSDNARFAIMEPDAKAQATMTQGTRPGDWQGEIFRGVMQFKSWPIMMVQRHMVGQTWKRFGNQGWDVPGAISFMGLILSTGYLSQTLKQVARGKTPQDVSKWETWMAAITQGGFLGIYGDLIFSPHTSPGGALASAAMGPIGGMLNDASDIPGLIARGEVEKARDKTARIAMSNVPFANLWFTKAAVDYFFMNEMKELMSPGYKRRMARQMEKTFGQKPLWD